MRVLLLAVCLLSFLSFPLSLGAASEAAQSVADNVWWHFEGQHRTRDGGVEADFTLRVPDGLAIAELEFFYSLDSFRYGPPATHSVQPKHQRKFYRKTVPADTRRLTVYGGSYAQLELWAVARVSGHESKTLVTQTALNLYGESGRDTTDFEELAEPPPLPGFNMNRKRGFYAAQTGEPVDFSVRGELSEKVRVILDGELVTTLRPEAGTYHYVLPRDRRLTGQALLEHRDLLFVADGVSGDGGGGTEAVRFTCCLPLYRSMRDNLHFPLGLTVLFSSVVVSLAAVLLQGRRFAWR